MKETIIEYACIALIIGGGVYFYSNIMSDKVIKEIEILKETSARIEESVAGIQKEIDEGFTIRLIK